MIRNILATAALVGGALFAAPAAQAQPPVHNGVADQGAAALGATSELLRGVAVVPTGAKTHWYDCSGHPNGDYLHPTDETKFITCANGRHAYERDCGVRHAGQRAGDMERGFCLDRWAKAA
ncbi:chitin binding peritrophin-A domain-containing protein [Streptomyces sp. P1-3]|uniref:chitin binding peritrophin-A domain-containing protein n=1 Tax=Streptomyces sp. P1-3 TaxID=3421658 RepID=UPI003D35CACC